MVNVDDAIIARLESFGEKFEILVDPDLAADFRNPDNEKEIEIEDISWLLKKYSRIPKKETRLLRKLWKRYLEQLMFWMWLVKFF